MTEDFAFSVSVFYTPGEISSQKWLFSFAFAFTHIDIDE